ncbi:carbohydrate-binding module family 12 protein [Moniliophthora roreri]|nr:carbohydrate-binding module family 12 protein [Moniliophthora roreri]
MARYWEPGTSYAIGDVVEYQGHRYKVIQAHTSQGDWTPPATPALWGRLDDNDQGYGGGQQQQQSWGQPPPASYQPPQQHYPAPPSDQKVHIHEEEQKKNWWDLSDERKKQLEIGGGLAAGAALLGAGFAAWKYHEKNEEQKKAELWAIQNWARDARARQNEYQAHGLRAPAMWIYNEGTNIPRDALSTGTEHDWTLYICRAPMEASNVFKKGAVIGFGNDEIHLAQYEILVGDMRGLRWVGTSGKLNPDNLGARPIEGGREGDGNPLFVARGPHKGAVHPGKAGPHLDGCRIPYDGKEKTIDQYEVLCYAE